MTDLRRVDDQRIDELNKKVDKVAGTVGEIRDWLIGEPQSSALGRALLERSQVNAKAIDELDRRLDPIEKWKTRWEGSWMLITGLAVVLGIVATFFAVVKPLIDAVPR